MMKQRKENLEKLNINNIDIWKKGINTEIFSPKYKNLNMRKNLINNITKINNPLLIYVGRLGKEKKLERLKLILDNINNINLVIVGAGPEENELKNIFKNYNNIKFMGPLSGFNIILKKINL